VTAGVRATGLRAAFHRGEQRKPFVMRPSCLARRSAEAIRLSAMQLGGQPESPCGRRASAFGRQRTLASRLGLASAAGTADLERDGSIDALRIRSSRQLFGNDGVTVIPTNCRARRQRGGRHSSTTLSFRSRSGVVDSTSRRAASSIAARWIRPRTRTTGGL